MPATVRLFTVALVVAFLIPCPRVLAQGRFDERALQATYLFQFAHFVEWPASSFESPSSPFVIAILGDDPFGALLDEAVRGETLGEHPLTVVRFSGPDAIDHCHILFVSPSAAPYQARVLAAVRRRPILTVGTTEGFATSVGIVRFTLDRNRVRLRINLNAAREVGLVISSQLLRAADIVTSGSR